MDPHQGAVGIPIHVTVLRGNNLFHRGNKNFVRAEFNGTVLGESARSEGAVGEGVNYNFTCILECSEPGHTLDDLAHTPVVLTVIESLQKEKKQKEEKTCVLGQAVIDLLPLLHGKCSFSSTVVLHPASGLPTESDSRDRGIKPTLEVTVSVSEPLLSDTQLSESNLFTVTVETAFSVPEVWSPGPPSCYVAALQVPFTAEREQILLFSNGELKMSGGREPVPRPKKWPLGPLLAPDAHFIPGVYIETEPSDLEDGDLNTEEDREFRAEAECNKKRVSWDTERRLFMDAAGAACLIRRITECRLWPVEVMKAPQAGGARPVAGKASKAQAEDEIQIPFHGVAYVDLAPLLYPGAKHIHGAYQLHPFYDSDLFMKTKRTRSVLRDSIKSPVAQARPRPPSSVGSCNVTPSKVFDTHRGGKDNKDSPKKTGPQGKSGQAESLIDVELQINTEGQMYADSRSYIIIEISLEKPLIPKRPSEELARRVMELIPPRPPLPRRPAGAERAMEEYQAQIESVAAQVVEQYQQMFGAAFIPGSEPLDPSTQEQRKSQLFGELNCSGKYLAFKEQMKYSVVRIVREKMLRTEAFSQPEQLRAFLSQLYVFLVDEMHVALNKTLTGDVQEVQPQLLLDCSQLGHFAREAELDGDYQLAAHYYKECLARDHSSPSPWFDYGVFHMLTTDYSKAEECFRMAVSIDQSHVPSLLMCGILSEMKEQHEEAGIFLEGATRIDPSSVVTWTLLGLFYLAGENFIQAEMAFLEATKQLRAPLQKSPVCGPDRADDTHSPTQGEREEGVDTTESPTNQEDKPAVEGDDKTRCQSSCEIQPEEGDKANAGDEPAALRQSTNRLNTTIYMESVKFLLKNNALQMAQRALAQELLCPDGGPSSSYHLALAHVQLLRGEYSSAEASLQGALVDNIQNPDIWAMFGHLNYLMKDYGQAQKCYERTLDFVTDASDTHPIYLRLGTIYLQSGEYEKAKTIYLRACSSSPSCRTWLGLGVACYRLGELREAEDALTEANTLENRNPEVWGYLSLICLKTGRKLEAEQSYKFALKFNLSEEALLHEITELQTQVGFGNPCFS
ncbi:cilia- and flagella-associated protein 70 [Brachyhypopomus gauderio]|uniref:cilia- and flagella-associated protein 70 n=1 Tax=Brachyhypopomus gauderio TaxID=698409 RepID=UPI0040417B0E